MFTNISASKMKLSMFLFKKQNNKIIKNVLVYQDLKCKALSTFLLIQRGEYLFC